MGMDGMQKFASDLGIEADDVFLFVFAWKAKAAKICEFSREEFVRGFEAVGYGWLRAALNHSITQSHIFSLSLSLSSRCKSIADLKAKVPTVRAMIDSKDGYRQYYEFFFDYSKEPHTKFMSAYSELLLRILPYLRHWLIDSSLLDRFCCRSGTRGHRHVAVGAWNAIHTTRSVPRVPGGTLLTMRCVALRSS